MIDRIGILDKLGVTITPADQRPACYSPLTVPICINYIEEPVIAGILESLRGVPFAVCQPDAEHIVVWRELIAEPSTATWTVGKEKRVGRPRGSRK